MKTRTRLQRDAVATVVALLITGSTVTSAAADPPVVSACGVVHSRSADTARGYATITRACSSGARRAATITFRPTQLAPGSSTTHRGSPVNRLNERSTATRPLANHTFISNGSVYA